MGLIFARELARRGYNVLAVARRRDRLEALAVEDRPDGDELIVVAFPKRLTEWL
jgi:short-subunit dehydrogenase